MQEKREDVARILLGRPDMAADGEEADKFVGLLRMFFAGPGGLRAVDADTCTFMEETLDMLLQHLQSQHPAMCKESEGHGVCLPLLKMLRACPRLPTPARCAARLPGPRGSHVLRLLSLAARLPPCPLPFLALALCSVGTRLTLRQLADPPCAAGVPHGGAAHAAGGGSHAQHGPGSSPRAAERLRQRVERHRGHGPACAVHDGRPGCDARAPGGAAPAGRVRQGGCREAGVGNQVVQSCAGDGAWCSQAGSPLNRCGWEI